MDGWLRLPLPFLAWLADASDHLWLEDTCKASEGPCGVNKAREAGDSSLSSRARRKVAGLGLAVRLASQDRTALDPF